jgi:hypothetical protein
MDLITAHNLMKPTMPSGSSARTTTPARPMIPVLWIRGRDMRRHRSVGQVASNIKAMSTLAKPCWCHLHRWKLLERTTELKTCLEKTYKNKQFIDSVLKKIDLPQDFDDSKSSTECDDSIKIIELRKQVDVLKSSICLLQGTDYFETIGC